MFCCPPVVGGSGGARSPPPRGKLQRIVTAGERDFNAGEVKIGQRKGEAASSRKQVAFGCFGETRAIV